MSPINVLNNDCTPIYYWIIYLYLMVYQIPNILTMIYSHFDENYIWNLLPKTKNKKKQPHTYNSIQEFKDFVTLIHGPD